MRSELTEWLRFLRASGHLLAERPAQFFQEAANQPAATSPSRVADLQVLARLGIPWLRWVNKPEHPSPCLLTLPTEELAERSDFSADGRLLACACGFTVMVWSTDTGSLVDSVPGLGQRFFRFAPKGSRMLGVGSTLWTWEQSGNLIEIPLPDAEVRCCDFSADGSAIVAGDDGGSVRVWDAASGRLLLAVQHGEASVLACLLTGPPERVVWASADGWLRQAEFPSGTLLSEAVVADRPITAWTLAPDGSRAASNGGNPVRMALWDTATGRELAQLLSYGRPRSCAFSPDGRWLSAHFSGRGSLVLWNGETGQQHSEIRGMVASWRFSRDSAHAAVAIQHGEVRLLALDGRGRKVRHKTGGAGALVDACVSPDGTSLASVNEGGLVQLWSVDSVADDEPTLGTVWTSVSVGDGFVCGLESGQIVAGDFATGIIQGACSHGLGQESGDPYRAEADPCVTACAVSADGRRLVSGAYGGSVNLWDVQTRGLIGAWHAHAGPVTALALDAEGGRCVSAGDDGSWKLWTQVGGEPGSLKPEGGVRTTWFSPGGEGVLGASTKGSLFLWTPPEQRFDRCGITEAERHALSPDGRLLLAGARARKLELWDLSEVWQRRAARRVAGFQPRGGELVACGFVSPSELFSVSLEGWVELWDVRSGARLAELSLGRRCLGALMKGDRIAAVTGVRPLRLGRMGEDWWGPGFPSDQVHVFEVVR